MSCSLMEVWSEGFCCNAGWHCPVCITDIHEYNMQNSSQQGILLLQGIVTVTGMIWLFIIIEFYELTIFVDTFVRIINTCK